MAVTPELISRGVHSDGRPKLSAAFHEGQQQAWESEARIVAVIAGHQSGKTSFGPLWLYREIERRGPGDYLAVTATYDLFKLKLLPELLSFFVRESGWGTYQATDRVITSHDGQTRIILRSAQSEGGLEAATAKAAWLDEAGQDDFSVEAWEAVIRRLSIHQGRILITTTPYNLGWLKSQVFDRAKGGDTNYHVIQFKSTQNPAFPVEEYERAKTVLPPWKFSMFYDGDFSRPAGLIYSDYDDSYAEFIPPEPGIAGLGYFSGDFIANVVVMGRSISTDRAPGGGCLVKPFSIPADWPRDVGVDFGGSLNNAQIWAAEDPRTLDLFLYREVSRVDNTGPEQARSATEYREPVRSCWGGAASEDEQRRSWAEAGFPVARPLISEVEAGIDRVIGLFRTRRLFVFDTLTRLRSDLGTYSRELDDAGEPLQRIKDKDKYHLLDAFRYLAGSYTLDRPKAKLPREVPPDDRTDEGLRRRLEWFAPKQSEDEYY